MVHTKGDLLKDINKMKQRRPKKSNPLATKGKNGQEVYHDSSDEEDAKPAKKDRCERFSEK